MWTQRIGESEAAPQPSLEPGPQPQPRPQPPPQPQPQPQQRRIEAANAAVGLGQKALGLASLRLEHRQRAAEVRNAQLVANSARAKEVRLRGEAVARAKAAHAAMLASARYTELRSAGWRQNDPGNSHGGDNESWLDSPYPHKAWLDPGRTPADAAKSVSESIQAMAQKSARANRLVVTERHGGLVVQIHRLQPPPQHTPATALNTAAHKRAGRLARALRLASDAPSSPYTKLAHQINTAGGSARANVTTGGLEVTPGLNGSAESSLMMLRDGEHTPLPAQFMSHHSPMPRAPKTGGSRSGGSHGGGCRVLISSSDEVAGVPSPGPAAYDAAVAYARLNSPRSFMRRADAHYKGSVAFGTTAAQRPVSTGNDGIRGAGSAAVPAMEGGAWGTGLGVFEETSWTKHIPLVAHEPGKPPQISPLLSI